MPTSRVYFGERRKKGVVLGGDIPLGRAPRQSPKSQLMLCRNTEVITSKRLWVSCPSHPCAALLLHEAADCISGTCSWYSVDG